MAAHRKLDQRRDDLCVGGLRKGASAKARATIFRSECGCLTETPFEFLESFRKQDTHDKRLTRNSPSETIASRNRGLVMDRHADDCD
jgi:hypothetical protein